MLGIRVEPCFVLMRASQRRHSLFDRQPEAVGLDGGVPRPCFISSHARSGEPGGFLSRAQDFAATHENPHHFVGRRSDGEWGDAVGDGGGKNPEDAQAFGFEVTGPPSLDHRVCFGFQQATGGEAVFQGLLDGRGEAVGGGGEGGLGEIHGFTRLETTGAGAPRDSAAVLLENEEVGDVATALVRIPLADGAALESEVRVDEGGEFHFLALETR